MAPRSLNEKFERPRVGVILSRQSTGLNAASPWKRSRETEKKSRLMNELFRPKNWNEPGRAVLSNPPEAGVGEERALAEDREVALQDVLVERVELAAGQVGVVVDQGVTLVVAVPLGVADPPAVLDGHEVVGRLGLAGQHARRPGVAGRGLDRRAKIAAWRPEEVGVRGLARRFGQCGVDRPS